MIQISAAKAEDKAAWQVLWEGYLGFYRHALAPEVTDLTFERALDPHQPMFLVLARDGDRVVGFATFVLHLSTWARTHYLYLEDLFVAEDMRGCGAGRAMIERIVEMGRQNGCERVYWVTQENNTAARGLYDKLAETPGLTTYFARM